MGESGATNTNVCVNIGSYDKIHMPNNQMLPDARLSRKQRVARGLGNGINVLTCTRSRMPTHAHAHARPHTDSDVSQIQVRLWQRVRYNEHLQRVAKQLIGQSG